MATGTIEVRIDVDMSAFARAAWRLSIGFAQLTYTLSGYERRRRARRRPVVVTCSDGVTRTFMRVAGEGRS